MLFNNFLCLLYLMVLADSHTISKSINEQKDIYAIYDNLNDYESTPDRIFHHEKCLQKHRRYNIEDTTIPVSRQQKTKEIFKHAEKTTKTDTPNLHLRPVHKSTKRRIGGFWRKFKIKGRNEDLDREKRLRQYLNKLPMSQVITTFDDYLKMTSRTVSNNNNFVLLKKKRDAEKLNDFEITTRPTVLNNAITDLTKDELNIKPNEKFSIDSRPYYRPYKSDADDLKKILSTITTKVAILKDTYNLNNYYMMNTSSKLSSYERFISENKESPTAVEETELIGTAQIEALLNSIKEKAISMIAEQNPAVTDLITNTVTEVTFEADPILNRIDIVNPEYASNILFSRKNIGYDKSTANFSEFEKDGITETYTQSHDIAARSIKDEAISLAQNVEEKLQKELKTIYKKVRNKVSSDLKKEMHEVKSTITHKINSTLKNAHTNIYHKTVKNTAVTRPISNSKKHSFTQSARQNRRDKVTIKDNKISKEAYIQTTIDDYAMLTLFEEMLNKTHENNVLKRLSTTDKISRKKRKEDLHYSKINIVALSDQAINKNINNNYDDDDEDQSQDIYDYNIHVTIPDITQTMSQSNDIENGKVISVGEGSKKNGEERNELKKEDSSDGIIYESNEIKEGKNEVTPSSSKEYLSQLSEAAQSTKQTYEDTSFENLSNKMSYNEYVNGYMHYLNFQKEQANQNFSNMVKYQAHRHHNVDDIGKYILNKIPQIPQLPSRDKRFFDDYDIDDQDISTKTDDSWLKKHFYMFVDSGPPKKFHTSQTVSLKSPITKISNAVVETYTDSSAVNGHTKHLESREETEISLDELSKNLFYENTSTDMSPVSDHVRSSNITNIPQNGKLVEIVPELKEFGPYLIGKLFGKARRTLKPHNEINADETKHSKTKLKEVNNNVQTDSDFIWDNDSNRYRRNAKKISRNIIQKEKQTTVKTSSSLTTSDKKHANVDVNIVPQTKPKKLSPKVDLINNLINLLHFGKHKNGTSKRAKREQRVQRFSPLKKFRDLFRAKPEDGLFKTNLNIPDYEMMRSHLDTFKPMKYNKILSAEEMKKQIPNITDDMAITSLKVNGLQIKKHKYNVTPKKKPVNSQFKNFNENFEVTKSYRTSTKKYDKPKTTARYQTIFTNTDDVFKVNVKTLATVGHSPNNIFATTTRMTIDDIKNEIDKMRFKISPEDHKNLLIKIPKTSSNYLELKSKKSQFDNYPTLAHSTRSLDIPKLGYMNNLFVNSKVVGDYNAFNYVRNAKPSHDTNKYTQKKDSTKASQKAESNKNRINNISTISKQMQYNNLYNDLLMWNNDILHSDKVSTPWQDTLKDIEPQNEYKPPNLEDIRKELTEVTDTLKDYQVVEPTIHSWAKEPKTLEIDLDKTAEVKNDALKGVSSGNKNVIIQEETFRINKKMKKSDRFRDYDYGVNRLKTPSYLFINQEDNVGLSKEDNRSDDLSLIYFDTTLLSYDDDINYITNKLTPRKLSRNSLKALDHKHKAASAQTVTKINEQPLQYFSTPLPMHTNDFEKFLKENHLDVASVTSPLNALPKVSTVRVSNLKTSSYTTPQKNINYKHSELTKNKTRIFYNQNEVDNFDTNADNFDYLEELHNELYNSDYDDKVRLKRYDETSNNSYVLTSKSYDLRNTDSNLNKIEENKHTVYPDVGEGVLVDNNNVPQKDVQVTIINFDNMDKNIERSTKPFLSDFHIDMDWRNPNKYTITTTEPTYSNSKSIRDTTAAEINFENLEKNTKDEEFFNKIHNNLLYNHIYTKKSTAKTFASRSDGNLGKALPLPADIFKEIPPKSGIKPKRVRISGQSYKYDIIYHHPEKKERGFSSAPSFETSTGKDIIFTDNFKRPSFNIFSANANAEVITEEQLEKRRFIRNGYSLLLTPKKDRKIIKENGVLSTKNKVEPIIEDITSEPSIYLDPKSEAFVSIAENISKNIMSKPNNDILVYMDPELYDNQVYFEYGMVKPYKSKQNLKNFTRKTTTKKSNLNKRDLSDNGTYTAKDVAALEVIVDMMKNKLNNEEKDDSNSKSSNFVTSCMTNSQAVNGKTETISNSIQVHIAIPYDNNDKKRSLEPVRVRKVFSAKLSSPVDLEYQVHSLEGTPTTDITTTNDGLSPGIYLVVDDSQIPKAIALKPIKSNLASFYRREAEIKTVTEKAVTQNPTKGLVKVTLSKDLLSAIIKHLEVYSNLTGSSNLPKNMKYIERVKMNNDRTKRSFNWDSIKKHFERDRVCNCKCKANKTMCRACVASDAVMNELIFEFDNLAKYMNDHCTEIQTYFRMNPSGGKKLRDSVHKIDKSLRDYFKRVKGKCQGRTCKTFATYMDKRDFLKQNKIEKSVGLNFINTLETVATDTEKASKLAPCFNPRLTKKRDELINTINNCICKRYHNKRANDQKRKQGVKNVYSLDNVNVNIICNSDSTTPGLHNEQSDINSDKVTQSNWNCDNITEISKKPEKFKNIFSFMKKSKIDKNIAKHNKRVKNKRHVRDEQIESPLIADTGGSFWYNYINRRSTEPKIDNIVEPDVKISVIQTQNVNKSTNSNKNDNTYINQNLKMLSTIPNQEIPKHEDQNTSDSAVFNINDFLKVLDNFKGAKKPIGDTKEIIMLKHNNTTKTSKKSRQKSQKKTTPRIKTVKKTHRNIKPKIDSHTKGKVKNVTDPTVERKTKTMPEVNKKTKPSNLDKLEIVTFIVNDNNSDKNSSQAVEPFINSIKDTANKDTKNKNTDLRNDQTLYNGVNKHVISEATTESNPTILILNDYSNKPGKYKSLLLSIIDHETNKLNNEWIRYAFTSNDVTEEMKSPLYVLNHFKRAGRKTTSLTTKQVNDATDNNIIKSHQSLGLSNSALKVQENEDGLLKKILSKLSKKVRGGEKTDKVVTEISGDETNVPLEKGKIIKDKQSREACDSIRAPQRLCDLKATLKRILGMYKKLKRTNFEIHVRNITCYKYRKAPTYIFINNNRSKTLNQVRKWNYKRLKRFTRRYPLNKNFIQDKININNFGNNNLEKGFRIEAKDGFETFYKGYDNIYTYNKRKRRNALFNDITGEIRNIPSSPSDLKEINVIAGDTVTLSCFSGSKPMTETHQFTWMADRKDMLDQDNIVIEGTIVTIRDVQPKNGGSYKCYKSTGFQENFIVSVFTLPTFNIIHSAMYSMDSSCTHQDFKTLELIGSKLSEMACFGTCSGDAREPTCLWDNNDGKAYIVVTVTLTPNPGPRVECSVQCRRDIRAAMATLLMDNIMTLGSVQVVLLENDVNKLLTPMVKQIGDSSMDVFSKKGFKLENNQNPRDSIGTRIVPSCPAGYQLLEDLNVCAACPVNAYAHEGDNKCFACPRGSSSAPGADRCRRVNQRPRSGGGTHRAVIAWRLVSSCVAVACAWRSRLSST